MLGLSLSKRDSRTSLYLRLVSVAGKWNSDVVENGFDLASRKRVANFLLDIG